MSNQANKLPVSVREGKGKGDARRARRAGTIPAVLYGHGTDPQHLLLPTLQFAAILRNNGLNAVIDLDIAGESQLALTKQVEIHPIKNYIQHVDLLVIKRGEKVAVDVSITVEGDAQPGTLVVQDASTLPVEADALSIPETIVVSVEGATAGTTITAADLTLPEGVTLNIDETTLIVAVNEAPSAAEMEADLDDDAAGTETAEATDEAAADAGSDD